MKNKINEFMRFLLKPVPSKYMWQSFIIYLIPLLAVMIIKEVTDISFILYVAIYLVVVLLECILLYMYIKKKE